MPCVHGLEAMAAGGAVKIPGRQELRGEMETGPLMRVIIPASPFSDPANERERARLVNLWLC